MSTIDVTNIDESKPGEGTALTADVRANMLEIKAQISNAKTDIVALENSNLKSAVLDIGDWDMNTVGDVTITHGISNFKNIRSVSVIIRRDNDTLYHDFASAESNLSAGTKWIYITETSIQLFRAPTGNFDNSAFSITPFNRGWITILYI